MAGVCLAVAGALGDETAVGLGQRPARTRLAASAVAVLLSAVAVALAGTIAFVGRVVARPGEVQAGVLTALLGAPFLVRLAVRTKAVA